MTTIVIVDDRVTNRNILVKLSKSLEPDATVVSFADAAEALLWMAWRDVDLVITDYKMPQVNGAEFVRRCLSELPGFDAPVVVVTAYEDKEFRYEALEAGATDFLLTPIDYREFRTRVQNLLMMRRNKRVIRDKADDLQRQLQAALDQQSQIIRKSERRLREVIDSNPNLIFTTDRQGRITLANRAFADVIGVPLEMPLNQMLGDVIPDQTFVTGCLDGVGRIEAGEAPPLTLELALRRDGEPADVIHLQVIQAPLQRDSEGLEILTVATDITQRKESEHRIIEAKQVAELSNRSKTEFLANMSHELRTPLNAIIGFSDMIIHEVYGSVGNSRYSSYVSDIKTSADHLLQIINDILEVSKIEAGKLQLREDEIELGRMCNEVTSLVSHRAVEQDVLLDIQNLSEMPRLYVDEAKLKQILVNLLVNAIKFTPSGGRITVWGEVRPDGGVSIVVQDSGVGMTPEEVAVATSRFGRVDNPFSHKHQGTGLGLPLAMDLARAHGGSLEIDSQPGIGTRIDIVLPAGRSLQPTNAG